MDKIRRKGTPIGQYGSDLDFGVPFYLINFKEQFITAIKGRVKLLMAFITAKEKANFKLVK